MPWRLCRRLIWLAALGLCACGGGGSGESAASGSSGGIGGQSGSVYAAGGANVVPITVGPGLNLKDRAFNVPFASVTVCIPGSSTCATIDHVLVDTGSSGLRLMASALGGLPLAPQPDPNLSGNVMAECLPFADGYTWGAVVPAALSMGGESISSVPIQLINDDGSFAPAVPESCTTFGSSLDSVAAFGANGVLGVGLRSQDCGSYCAQVSGNPGWYYTCTDSRCSPGVEALEDQVANPVVFLSKDNNGVILQLPSIPANGAASATGYLVFGIGTESNNGLGAATVLTVDPVTGDFTTSYGGRMYGGSFIDSGSNGLFFSDTSIASCSSSVGVDFYCPASMLSLTASDQGENGNTSSVSFQIADLARLNSNQFALDDVGGSGSKFAGLGTQFFDWGMPFFYGRTVYTAIEGQIAGNATGPYFAF
jgi:hypothetical protein